jgi:actin-related protein
MDQPVTINDMLVLMREDREKMREDRERIREDRESFRLMSQETDRKFQETRELIRESSRETDRKFQETERLMRESSEKLNRKMGELGNKLGSVVEHMIIPDIEKKFNDMGYTFENVSTNLKMKDPSGITYAEVDIVLENGEYVLLIEVKTDLKIEHIKEHVRRMDTIRSRGRKWPDKKLLGAVSAAIVEDNVREYAKKNGFFVISQAGETMRVDKPEGEFSVKEW